MNAKELREKSVDELSKELGDLTTELFNLRMQKAMGQMAKTHLMPNVKKSIARIKTILEEKRV